MYPILNVGPAAIQLPGLILLVGFYLSLTLAGRLAKSAGFSEDAIFNAGMMALLGGLVGARLGYVALNWSAYQNDLGGIFALTTGGLSVPAGLLVGLGIAALYLGLRLSRSQASAAALLDALAPALAAMLAFVSLANLSAGSAYGQLSDLPWAIQLWGARRHPTQIYELLAAVATLGILLWVRPRRPYEGFVFLLFVLIFGGARLFLEAFRADPWLLPGGFRAMQILSLGAILLALGWMARRTHPAPHA
jgi:prolipoprotein diacylglyceryl transferase